MEASLGAVRVSSIFLPILSSLDQPLRSTDGFSICVQAAGLGMIQVSGGGTDH